MRSGAGRGDLVLRPALADDVERIADAIDEARIWVAERGGVIAGYALAEVLDGNAHVAQVSVAPEHAGQAIGRQLVEIVEEWGRRAGRPATTLTTFSDVPWNGPYYARLGYRVIAADLIGPELAAEIAHEASFPGLDRSPRCAMRKPNEASPRIPPPDAAALCSDP